MQKINQNAFAFAGAIVSAVIMLLLGVLGNLGVYEGAAKMMEEWHMFYSLSLGGIIAGIIEASIISYVFIFLFTWIYNRLAK